MKIYPKFIDILSLLGQVAGVCKWGQTLGAEVRLRTDIKIRQRGVFLSGLCSVFLKGFRCDIKRVGIDPMCRVWSVARRERKSQKSGEYLKNMENWTDPFSFLFLEDFIVQGHNVEMYYF